MPKYSSIDQINLSRMNPGYKGRVAWAAGCCAAPESFRLAELSHIPAG
jgi:hypothetical protein